MTRPRAALLGNGVVAMATLDRLSREGFDVFAVSSHDHALLELARNHGIPTCADLAAFTGALRERPFDYLLSVNNGWILPREILDLPRAAAINYHDAPLPAYGGLFATSWALLHGESSHGVTFHRMAAEIDAGDVLVQREVSIHPRETAHSLNAKCYEAALSALDELIPQLAQRQLNGRPQARSGASYFGLGERPANAGLLDFDAPAEALDRLVRATLLGTVENRFAAAKCKLGDVVYVVLGLTVLPERSGVRPGTLLRLDADGIAIATRTHDVVLTKLATLDGTEQSLEVVARRPALVAGARIHLVASELAAVDARFRACARHERFWMDRVRAAVPLSGTITAAPTRSQPKLVALSRFGALCAQHDLAADAQLTLIAGYLLRSTTEHEAWVGWEARLSDGLSRRLFAETVPLRLAQHERPSFARFADDFRVELALVRKRDTFAHDACARTPTLRGKQRARFEVSMAQLERPDATLQHGSVDLVYRVHADGSPAALWSATELDDEALAAIDLQLATFASAALRDMDQPLAQLPILSAEVEQRILVDWNATDRVYPRDATLHALISDQAKRTPDALAVRFGHESLRYAQLDLASDALAEQLIAHGVGVGDRVVFCADRSVRLPVALLAILKSGAAYVPIDPAYPAERREHIVRLARPRAVICDRGRHAAFAKLAPCLVLEDAPATPTGLVRPRASGDDIAYVIFTSGSTGTPKGVEVPHRGIVNHSLAIGHNYALDEGDRMLCSASIGFDVCGEQIYPALLRGAAVVVRPEDLFDALSRFERFVGDEQITALVLPTSFWHEWVRALGEGVGAVPPILRVLSVGTEKVLPEYLAGWQRAARGRVRFFQGYGPTETSVTCTMYSLEPERDPGVGAVPIGKPLPNVRAYVLDAMLRPVPVGRVGELFIGGDGLARGYLGDDAQTRARFLPNPFRPSERMYRTGDNVRLTSTGELIYVGRGDDQVKIRGYRVELKEVEAALQSLAGVAESAVLLRHDGGAPRLVAYVLPKHGVSLDFAALRDALSLRLPDYMVPAAFVRMTEFPRTINQKIDRKALPAPDADEHRAFEAPATPLEAELCTLCASLLGRKSVGATDDFFHVLGGDSLLAIRLLDQIERTKHVRIALSAFSHAPTMRAVAAELGSAQRGKSPYLVLQRGSSEHAPLWLFPAAGGHVVYGEWLRRGMSASRPIYGIEAVGLGASDPAPFERIEDAARAYLQVVRRAQTRGPYFLGGPSIGGLIAWETARLLEASGETVALVVLVDTWGPGYPEATSSGVRVLDQVQNVLRQPSFSAVRELVKERVAARLPTRRAPRYTAGEGVEGDLGERIRRVAAAAEIANERYVPGPIASDVLLLRAQRTPRMSGYRFRAHDNGWAPLVQGQLEVREIDEEHIALADRPSMQVAAFVERALRARERRVPALRLIAGTP